MKRERGRRASRRQALALAAALCLGLLVGWVEDLQAKEDFPKVANIYFATLIGADLEALARWDMLVLPKRAQTWYQDELTTIRGLNPDIKILVHMPVGYNGAWEAPEDNALLTEKIEASNWWLRDIQGQKAMCNDRDALLNITLDCPTDSQGDRLCEWLPVYISERLGPGGWWDGVFLDFCMSEISWSNVYLPRPIDSDGDGVADEDEELDASWDAGMRVLLARLRSLVGDGYVVVTNGNNTYYDLCDGSTRENFPSMHGGWYQNIAHPEYGYLAMGSYREPTANIINTVWTGPATYGGPIRTPEFERKFGLTFASTLVFGDGYYSLNGLGYSEVWWHEYFDIDLGRACGRAERAAANPGDAPGIEHAEMIRARRFERGLAVVNPTDCAQHVQLPGFYFAPECWNGEFYPNEEATMWVELDERSGAVLVGSGRLLAVPAGLAGYRAGGTNCLTWPGTDGAARYSVYRVDVGHDGHEGERALIAVVSEPCFVDESARTSVSRYFVAAVDELGCEGQLSCPVEVSSGLGSDLSLALVADDKPDGTLALLWEQDGLPDGCLFDIVRTDAAGERLLLTDEPVDPAATTEWVDTTAQPGETYLYEAVLSGGWDAEIVIGAVTAAALPEESARLRLVGLWPHPMSEYTTFHLDVGGRAGDVGVGASLTIYDVSGRVVRSLCDGQLHAGLHAVAWDGRSDSGERVASGCYLYSLESGPDVQSGKILVVR